MGKFSYRFINDGVVGPLQQETDPANPSRDEVIAIVQEVKQKYNYKSESIYHLNGDITVELNGKAYGRSVQLVGLFVNAADGSIGQPKGEDVGSRCNRNGCNGKIEECETNSCCSCHIVAPCSHCTTDRRHCPECDWEADQA